MSKGLISATIAALIGSAFAWAHGGPQLQGTWILVSSVMHRDGNDTHQFGVGAQGRMMLDGAGHFMLTIVGSSLPSFSSGNRATGTPEENKAVVAGSIAMFGRYAYDPSSKVLELRTEQATFPNWNGSRQKRSLVRLDAGELSYTTDRASGGGSATVTWKRAE